MWGKSSEPPDIQRDNQMEKASTSSVLDESVESNSDTLNYVDLMLKNQMDLKKKKEEFEEYAEKLSKIKSKVKSSRLKTTKSQPQVDSSVEEDSSKTEESDNDNVKNVFTAKNPQEKAHLLQKKLAENRIIFEQINETNRAAEEKVEAIRQQITETELKKEILTSALHSKPVVNDEKLLNKIAENEMRIHQLEAMVIDLQDSLKEKDSVINSKTQAITLLTEDLSKKGKTTLDTLEDTKDEMRSMQQNFVLIETSLKQKVDHLLSQLESKESQIQNQQELVEKFTTQVDDKQQVITNLERRILDLEAEKSHVDAKEEKDVDDDVVKLKKDLEESNKAMIKLKAQYKSKLKNMQKRLDNFKSMSDANTELVKLENQVALLEEEKGNLQLNLVDFDEMKVSNEELQRQLKDLDSKVLNQGKDIQSYLEAIATLENQKLDLMQELHGVKQEVSYLEAENAESENQRVTAEMKIVELEEEIENLNKINENSDRNSGVNVSEYNDLVIKMTKLQEKFDDLVNERNQVSEEVNKLKDENSRLLDSNRLIEDEQSNMIESYETKLKNEKDYIENLKNEIMDLQSALVKKQTLVEEFTSEQTDEKTLNTKLLEELQDLTTKLSNSSLELDRTNLLVKELQEVINLKEKDINLLSESNGESMKTISTLEEQIKLKNEDLEELKLQIDTKMKENSELIHYNEILRFGIADLEKQLAESKTEKDNINLKIQEEATKNIDLSNKIEELNTILTERDDSVDKMSKQIENLLYKLETKDNYDENQQVLCQKLEMQVSSLENAIVDKEKMLSDLWEKEKLIEEVNLSLKNQISELEQKLIDKENTLAELSAVISQSEVKINEEMSKNIENLRLIEQLESKINNYESENDHLKVELENEIAQNKILLSKVEDYTEKLEVFETQKATLKSELATKEEDLVKNMENINQLNAEIENLKLKMIENDDKLIKQKEMMERMTTESEERFILLNQLQTEYNNLTQYSDDLKTELNSAYKMMEQLKAKHSEDLELLNQQRQSLFEEQASKMQDTNEKELLMEQINALKSELEAANNNNQAQLQKMKIIAANLKKKTSHCHELETRLLDFEEKWQNEEKEKENFELKLAQLETDLSNKNQQLLSLEASLQEVNNLKNEMSIEYENYREQMELAMADQSQELIETKDKARELSVRMQVIETEYLDQKNLIQNLKTENGIILSKQIQLNEHLEMLQIELNEKNMKILNLEREIFDLNESKKLAEEETVIENKSDVLFDAAKCFKSDDIPVEDWRKRAEELESSFLELQTQNENLIVNNSNVNHQLAKESNEKLNLLKQIEDFTNKIQVLEMDNERLKAIVVDLENQIENKLAEIKDLEMKNINEVKETVSEGLVIDPETFINPESVKLDVDEDGWGWNAQDISTAEGDDEGKQVIHGSLMPLASNEIQLQTKIDELEDTIKDLEIEKNNLSEEMKTISTKNMKLMKKLKEFKIQIESLQQQLKFQLSSGGLSDLDSAIEEELKSQVSSLEKQISEMKNDGEKLAIEKENLLKRIDVLTAANDRFTEMKERQDRDIEVLQIRNNELIQKLKSLELNGEEKLPVSNDNKMECPNCVNNISELADLRENLELLAQENEELRGIIETSKVEWEKQKEEIKASKDQKEELKVNFFDMLEKSHYLEKQCQVELDDKSHENYLVQKEFEERIEKLLANIQELEAQIGEKNLLINELEQKVEYISENLKEKQSNLENLTDDLDRANFALQEDQIKFDSLQQNCQLFEMELNSTKLQLETELEKINERNIQVGELEKQLDEAKRSAQMNLEELNQQKEALQKAYDEYVQESSLKINNLQSEVVDKDSKIQYLEDTLEKTLKNHAEKITELEQVKSTPIEKDSSQEGNQQQQKDEDNQIYRYFVADSDPQTEKLRLEVSEKDARIKILEDKLADSLQDREKSVLLVNDAESKLLELNDSLSTVTELLNVRVQEVADLKQYIQRLEFDKRNLETCQVDKDDLIQKLSEKDVELLSLTKEISDLQLQVSNKNHEISSLESQLSELSSKREEMVLEIDKQSLDLKTLKDILNNNEMMIDELKSNLSSKEDEIVQLKDELKECKEEISRLEQVVADIEETNALKSKKYDEQLADSGLTIANLNSEVEKLQKSTSEIPEDYENKTKDTINKLQNDVTAKQEEIDDLKYILQESTYPAIIQQMQNKIDSLYDEKCNLEKMMLSNVQQTSPTEDLKKTDANTSDLDVALYMLHQRDVRIEELTQELMQLLEERDTLQLRLSNAIKINEELRKISPIASDELSAINQEQIDNQTSSNDESSLLAQKLSQLHLVGHRKDVRLKDDREFRHNQQMSLLTSQNDALNTLPPDAAARIINAKYTISRDMQSQSSILFNWLWGKSTPKVVHM